MADVASVARRDGVGDAGLRYRAKESRMKKVAIGCLIVAGVLIVVLGIGGFLLYRAASPFLAGVRQLAEIPEIEKTIANTSSFEPPASGELTEEMVKRFATVQEAVQAKLSGRVNELRTKVDQIDRAIKEQDRKASPTEVFSALSGLATLVVEGKRAQVEAINKTGFSRRDTSGFAGRSTRRRA